MKIDPSGLPMMSTADILMIEEIIRSSPFVKLRVLEWGAGNSTTHFIQGAEDILSWTSIEHDGNYIKYLAPVIDPRVNLIWAPEVAGQSNDFYVDCVKHNKGYDIILIDGISEQREKCLEAAMQMIHENGIVLLHDADREEYQEFIAKYPHKKRLTSGEIPTKNGGFVHRGITAFYKK